MRFGYDEACLEHDPGGRHPESADRLRAIRRALLERHGVAFEDAPPATREQLAAVHDSDYVREVEAFCEDGGGSWDLDTVAVAGTWRAARASAGLACWAAEAGVAGATGRDTPFSLGRPPGHHAVANEAMGFCFFNNVAVAARSVLDDGAVDRVAVLDWDVHHGNGTQDLFYGDGTVFYASIHEDGLYPGTGGVAETGTDDGEGTTLNVPMPAGAGDAAYLAVVDEAVAPAIEAFGPDLVLVSAGFDAHRHDPISRMRVSTEGFGALAARVRDLADATGAGLGFVLEGGYNLDTLANSVGIVHAVFGGRVPEPEGGEVPDGVRRVLADARGAHGLGSK